MIYFHLLTRLEVEENYQSEENNQKEENYQSEENENINYKNVSKYNYEFINRIVVYFISKYYIMSLKKQSKKKINKPYTYCLQN
jgi:hypothetical protein